MLHLCTGFQQRVLNAGWRMLRCGCGLQLGIPQPHSAGDRAAPQHVRVAHAGRQRDGELVPAEARHVGNILQVQDHTLTALMSCCLCAPALAAVRSLNEALAQEAA